MLLLREDPECLHGVLRDGAIHANVFASQILDSAKVNMGFTRKTRRLLFYGLINSFDFLVEFSVFVS